MDMDSNALRKTFIAMLFALVVGALAEKFSQILFVVTDGWNLVIFGKAFFTNLVKDDFLLLVPVCHAVLALILVSASWVGWSKSKAGGHKAKILELFSYPFLLLIIEVMLVTMYFGLVKSVELNVPDSPLPIANGSAIVANPSAIRESVLLMGVFTVFFIWDVVADVLSSPLGSRDRKGGPRPPSTLIKAFGYLTGPLTFGFVSIICTLLCYIVYVISPLSGHPYFAILGDLALISVIGIFHSAKCIEPYLTHLFPWEATRDNTLRSLPLSRDKVVKMLIPIFLYILFVVSLCVLKSSCP